MGPPIEWRYLPQRNRRREVRHAILDFYGHGVTSGTPAICGVVPAFLGDWYGTGTQAEYERASTLPVCGHCRHRLARLGYEDPGVSTD